ncbi:MAG: H-type small acid-soluble spore protein [Firmicutes bacterium]|nr:H-type small acid-soluble spore protein [Bacillota bacterium]
MDYERIKDIIESHGVIEVRYQNSPVWIEQIKDKETAEVTLLDTKERMEAPISELTERQY